MQIDVDPISDTGKGKIDGSHAVRNPNRVEIRELSSRKKRGRRRRRCEAVVPLLEHVSGIYNDGDADESL